MKIFRHIPKGDLEILFPNVHLKLQLVDKLWLWVGSGGSTAFAIVMAILKFVAAFAIINLYFIVVTLFGAVGAVIRTVLSFFNTRTRYIAKLAQHLYCRTIASNQSVLASLCDDAEEEDIKETVLTYALLLRYGHLGMEGVRQEANRFLKDEFSVDCDFDLEDGCGKLRRLGLLGEDETGAPRIHDYVSAREKLEAMWIALPGMEGPAKAA